MIIKFLKKYYLLSLALFISLVFVGYYFNTYSTNYSSDIKEHNSSLHLLDKKLDDAIRYRVDELKKGGINKQWNSLDDSDEINIHIYRNDSLKYWNTNQLPIIRFAEIHFPAEGVLHLQNGWYYAKIQEVDDFLVCGSFLIKQDFSYQNKELVNGFHENLGISFSATIGIGEDQGYPIFSKENKYIYSIIPDDIQQVNRTNSITLFIFLLVTIISWLYLLLVVGQKAKSKATWIIPIIVILLRIASLHFGWFTFLNDTIGFDPSLYGTNKWLPNFFEYILNVTIIVYLLSVIRQIINGIKPGLTFKIIAVVLFVMSILIWSLILFFTQGLIENSSISLVLDKLFTLDAFSILAITSIGVLFYSFFRYLLAIVQFCKSQNVYATQLAVLGFIVGCIYFYYEINFNNQILLEALFPIIFFGLTLYIVFSDQKSRQVGTGLILLFVFSAVMSVTIGKLNIRKEKAERELYANQLATEKSIIAEVEYSSLSKELKEDKFLQKLISSEFKMSISNFQENLERRYFNGFWERYEMRFSMFNSDSLPLVDKRTITTDAYNNLKKIITESGTQSEIDSNIYFINDFTDQYSYIIRQEIITKNGKKGILFCTLKSKKIPEEIGFPRLLISSKANVLESLETYSIAKYHSNRLITKYGSFNFPSSYTIMTPEKMASKGFFDYDGYNHYLLKKSDNNVVVLSIKNSGWIDIVTAFSYLFSFYGLLLLPLIFRMNANRNYRRTFSLAMKIQLVLISLVFLSLLAFGWGSGVFVSTQYNQYTNDVIREKLSSVETEVKAKLGAFDELSIDENGDYMQYILQKFSRVFFTDINLYDTDGYLLATSRPKVFNVGLISEQMNPMAFKNLHYEQKSEFVHHEDIGELTYSSAYQPFYNKAGKQLAFINLQHFGQQREFENQIQKFLVAIINVFILLLAISMILAIFVSNWLTSPLRILQESFSSVKFGKLNERISYDKEDEIGSLVKDYNKKLDELEFTAQQLAKSERESAWREMAKQVAHEIKNPLTPMKLSVQQLLRVYNPEDPKSEEKLKKVANSIVEQIDALTKIANEFSNFAKMPNPSEEKLDLLLIASGVKEVFTHEGQTKININSKNKEVLIHADKDQMIRVFNNLIKNAIQSIPQDREGRIEINIEQVMNQAVISISDNGVGIDQSKINKIFVPYFTTKSTGTGLGLAMVKQIIENHNGIISFETVEDKGTVFTIVLPIIE